MLKYFSTMCPDVRRYLRLCYSCCVQATPVYPSLVRHFSAAAKRRYVARDGGLLTAPPCPKELPEKPGHLFRLTLGLHPDYGDDRTVTLDLLTSEKELEEAQKRLDTLQWENTVVLDYDGIIPNTAEFAGLPAEMEAFNEFDKAVKNIPARQVQLPKLKALLEQFDVQDIGTAILLAERMDEYILTPEISSPQETAVDQLRFLLDDAAAELLISHVNLYAYGCDIIKDDNASLAPCGLLRRADYQPMLSPAHETQKMEMKTLRRKKAALSMDCCGSSRQTANSLWTAMRGIPATTRKKR